MEMVTIEGRVVRFLFINPHSFVILTDKHGAQWIAEWDSANSLRRRQGVDPDTLRPGDHVEVQGYAAREADRLYIVNIRRVADSWQWRRHK